MRLDTICGTPPNSVIARPSATRSGQNATSTSRPRSATIFSSWAVLPGQTLLRTMRIWPSRRYPAQSSSARTIALGPDDSQV